MPNGYLYSHSRVYPFFLLEDIILYLYNMIYSFLSLGKKEKEINIGKGECERENLTIISPTKMEFVRE